MIFSDKIQIEVSPRYLAGLASAAIPLERARHQRIEAQQRALGFSERHILSYAEATGGNGNDDLVYLSLLADAPESAVARISAFRLSELIRMATADAISEPLP